VTKTFRGIQLDRSGPAAAGQAANIESYAAPLLTTLLPLFAAAKPLQFVSLTAGKAKVSL